MDVLSWPTDDLGKWRLRARRRGDRNELVLRGKDELLLMMMLLLLLLVVENNVRGEDILEIHSGTGGNCESRGRIRRLGSEQVCILLQRWV